MFRLPEKTSFRAALGDAKSAGKTVDEVKLAGALAAQQNGVTGTLKETL
jgi:hypothetical protein